MGKKDLNTKKSKVHVEAESDEEEIEIPAQVKKVKLNNGAPTKGIAAQNDHKANQKKKIQAKPHSDDDEDEDAEEAPINSKKSGAQKNGGQKSVGLKGKKEESDEEFDDEDQPKDFKKKVSASFKAANAQKGGKQSSKFAAEDDDDDDEEEEKVAAPAKNRNQKDENNPKTSGGSTFEVYVNNINLKASESDITGHFESCGTVESVNLLKRPDGSFKGVAFVRFSDQEALLAAIELNGSEFMGRVIKVEKTTPREQRTDRNNYQSENNNRQRSDNSGNTIWVGNLSWNTNEDSLKDFFSECGNVTGIRIAKDDTGRMKGYAHVDFDDSAATQKAIEFAGTELDGRALKIDVAGAKKSNGGGYGGGYGGGGYGGGGFGGGRGRDSYRGGRSGSRGGGRGRY